MLNNISSQSSLNSIFSGPKVAPAPDKTVVGQPSAITASSGPAKPSEQSPGIRPTGPQQEKLNSAAQLLSAVPVAIDNVENSKTSLPSSAANGAEAGPTKKLGELATNLTKTLNFKEGFLYRFANTVGLGKTTDRSARTISDKMNSLHKLSGNARADAFKDIRASLDKYNRSTQRAITAQHGKSEKLEGRLAAMEAAFSDMCKLCDIEVAKGKGLSTTTLTSSYEAERYEVTVKGTAINIRGTDINSQMKKAIKLAGPNGDVKAALQSVIDQRIESKGEREADKLLEKKVEFMNPKEVSKRTVTMSDGKFLQDGKEMKPGKYAFVISPDGDLMMKPKLKSEQNEGAGNVQHSSFLHAGDVSGAGFIEILANGDANINNSSGHYQPDETLVAQAIDKLTEMGMDIGNIKVDFTPGGSAGVAVREIGKYAPSIVNMMYPPNVPASEFIKNHNALSLS